jgi:hypothetical protein
MLDALNRYQPASILSLHAKLAEIPKSVEEVRNNLASGGLTAIQELRYAAQEIKSGLVAENSHLVVSLRKEIVEVIRNELCNFQNDSRGPIRDLSASLAFDRNLHMDRGELSLEYGTMADYLQQIWRNGGYTTDQDVWGCFVDIFEVYKDPKFRRSLRRVPLDERLGNELLGT